MNFVEKKITYPKLGEDGWYYCWGFRWHGKVKDGYFTECSDLEKVEKEKEDGSLV